jgi:sugar phosphate permease
MKKCKLFYGWWIVVAAFFISAYANGVVFYSFTAIFEPVVKDLGLSYTQVSFAASIRGFETSFLGPLVGFLFDRFGPRRLIFAGAVIIGIGLLLLSRTNSLGTFYFSFFLMAMGLSSCTGFILTSVVGNWFRKKATTVMGITLCGSAVGGLLVPLVTRLIDVLDWRMAMVVIGLVAWCILLPLSLLVRHKPEQYGYLPDGDEMIEPVSTETLTTPQKTEMSTGMRQTLKSRVFWLISLGFLTHYLVISAVLTHIMPYLSSINVPRSSSSLAASGIPLASILGRLTFGWFGDRFDKRRVAAIGFILTALGLLLLNYIDTIGTWILVPFVIIFGVGFGGPVPLALSMLLGYFGRARSSSIVGLFMGVIVIGSIVGPPLAGWIFDNYGSYQIAWFAYVGITIVGMTMLIIAPPVNSVRERTYRSGKSSKYPASGT